MPSAWRIMYADRVDLTGRGASDHGGRWNSPGIPMVYASETLSLAALEVLAHLKLPGPAEFVSVRFEFPADYVERISGDELPAEWKSEPPAAPTKQHGDAWVTEKRTAVLAVPSVMVEGELNYIFNPAHPDFKNIEIGKPEPFAFDSRLIR